MPGYRIKFGFTKILVIVACSLASLSSSSQENTCDCGNNLDSLIARTERNYAGYPQKVNVQTRSQYAALKKSLSVKAAGISKAKPCFFVLRQYVKFFYDSHFQLTYYDENDLDIQKISLTEEDVRRRLKPGNTDGMEGIWVNQDSSLRLAILKYPDASFKAIVLDSKDPKLDRGLVYMTIRPGKKGWVVNYYNAFSATDYPIKRKGNLLQGWSDEFFGRIYPAQMGNAELMELNSWKNNNHGLWFYKLSARTAVLKIPSFGNNDDKIAQLVAANDAVIRNTENLIVDLTGNGGGSTGWVSFLGYFMTRPIKQENGFVRVSPENVSLKLADIEPYVVNPIPDDYKKYFPSDVLQVYQKAFKELPVTQLPFYPVPGVVFPLDSITAKPRKIALVVDDLCGSSTEYFFFLSKASSKTRSYGVNTFGMMDYEGASSNALPYSRFRVSIPIVKSSWTDKKPIDKTGFRPDVLLNKIPPEKWIQYIQSEMER